MPRILTVKSQENRIVRIEDKSQEIKEGEQKIKGARDEDRKIPSIATSTISNERRGTKEGKIIKRQ